VLGYSSAFELGKTKVALAASKAQQYALRLPQATD